GGAHRGGVRADDPARAALLRGRRGGDRRGRRALARDAARLPGGVPVRPHASAQRGRGARNGGLRAGALPAPARAQPGRAADAVPQHGPDVARDDRRGRRPAHRGVPRGGARARRRGRARAAVGRPGRRDGARPYEDSARRRLVRANQASGATVPARGTSASEAARRVGMRRRPGRGRRRRVLRRADPSSSPRRISTRQREGGPLTPQLATLGVATAVVALLAFRSGGYFPSDWGLELGFFALLALVLALAAERLQLGRRDLALVAGLGLLAAWSLASAAWSTGPDGPVLAAERTLVYAAAALALALGLSAARVPWLLAGVGVALLVACGYGLATRLLVGQLGDAEDAVTGTRLAEPIGYANALGALAAMAIVLALGFARHRRREVRAVAGASLVPLASVLYLTLSRGSLLALAVALLVLAAAGGAGETAGSLLVLSLPPAAGVLLTVRSPLLDGGLTIERAQSAGHRLGGELVLLALAGGAAGLVARPLARRLAGAA